MIRCTNLEASGPGQEDAQQLIYQKYLNDIIARLERTPSSKQISRSLLDPSEQRSRRDRIERSSSHIKRQPDPSEQLNSGISRFFRLEKSFSRYSERSVYRTPPASTMRGKRFEVGAGSPARHSLKCREADKNGDDGDAARKATEMSPGESSGASIYNVDTREKAQITRRK
jgi:hypothetical protein